LTPHFTLHSANSIIVEDDGGYASKPNKLGEAQCCGSISCCEASSENTPSGGTVC
jgi:hypothetical protein